MRLVFLSLALIAMTSAGAARPAAAQDSVAIPSFAEETASAGIDSVYAGEWEYMVGGGVATFDCNGDDFDDMLLAGGASPAKFYRNASTRGGALHFKAETSGLELVRVQHLHEARAIFSVLQIGELVLEGRSDPLNRMAEQVEQQEALHLEGDVGIDDDPQTVEDARFGRLEIAVLDDKPLLDHARTHFSPQIDELVGRPSAKLPCAVELVTGDTVHRLEIMSECLGSRAS